MSQAYRNLFYLLFALSGFTGLVYESVWTRYLRLFLGHSAYAQSLVIAIFMGGMAIGAWICGRYITRWRNLFTGYALAEGMIGLFALFFHDVFAQFLQFAQLNFLPNLLSPAAIASFKWTAASLFILPQTILLGMTFPLMSSGILRSNPDNPGHTLAMLYFTNSIGAVFGVLISGFILINTLGLPGSIRSAGLVNIALAVTVIVLSRNLPAPPPPAEKQAKDKPVKKEWHILLLFVAFFSGTASFVYEIGWIRMLSLVLGSSTHSFEIMLAAFILGLALGSLWIRKKIDHSMAPIMLLATVQILMGLFAAATLPVYGQSFKLMQWLMTVLERTDSGYFLYLLASSFFAIAVMLPATFCAGMTLPLITRILFDEQQGEKNIGYVYAMNTAGGIIGVFVALHLGMIYLGLKGLILLGSWIDLALGILLITFSSGRTKIFWPRIAGPLAAVIILATLALVTHLDLYQMASGVYRHGKMLDRENTEILYHRDGKTATISVFLNNGNKLNIATNGKVDASVGIGPERKSVDSDNSTQVQLAAIPMALNPKATKVANIGFGSGITSSVVLKNSRITRLDTIEIEPLVVEAARNFGDRVLPVYEDPRSHIHIDDARTYFSSVGQKFDIIISEPSNPWVSGVAGLFTAEFYRTAKTALAPDGIFAQWVQMYELDAGLLSSIFKAIGNTFSDYEVYAMNDVDLIIIAKQGGPIGLLDRDTLSRPAMRDELREIFVESPRDIEFRWIGSNKTLRPFFASLPVDANSDFHPILDQHGARIRFLGSGSSELARFNYVFFNLARLLEQRKWKYQVEDITLTPSFPAPTAQAVRAQFLRDYHLENDTLTTDDLISPQLRENAQALQDICRGTYKGPAANRILTLYYQGIEMLPFLSRDEFARVWETLESSGARKNLNQAEYAWFALFQSINAGDGPRMQSLATNLFDIGRNLPDHVTDFLVASALTGDLLTGNYSRSNNLWNNYREKRFAKEQPPLFFLILAAHLQE